ncbi:MULTISPECIES: helix-turn-helix domain-containing protein [Dyadobacter]|jgi:transcriptional regulator with XRE-family HTH domain|uniref:Helix-turn-helix domain-containing protein n=1 Tax=Dyadobacter chenhuakuii TaxID=2909339 RepID=A0A9X1Q9S9_9BACT|nr:MULTISPECIES: helix-turn-helix domain-containing protein [Dyadobacter]MCE7072366.1 helix-turn-helix domain-containing protein [Dyadobacter sp. CY327]MCF2494585.1 helix-turn-helix domain-containing protein [Dyadobacter chenhuakuii]MCF2497510.1 helix-turn-helix domain-containing protein [Dyadobacter chenhuakuii]MCF2519686.1 helix-turn-helix domain-containing protein [Dyadobacter sp. CY351]USJ32093.1 helix-turn-helix domain-containing protein [Dyadobacter chenhuakuii]
MISIGQRIKQGREKLGLSQEQLALIMAKKGKGTISNWETNKNEPSIAEFKKLAELFSTTAAYLIGESPQFEEPQENYVMVKKDDLIELQKKALEREAEKNKELLDLLEQARKSEENEA